MNPYVAQMISY